MFRRRWLMLLLPKLWTFVTGRPYWTSRCMADEFGPPPAVVYWEEWEGLTDAQLMALKVKVPRSGRR